MSSHIDEYTIKCWNDCLMSGCPSHTIKIEANNTSDALVYSKDGEHKFGMDFDELDAFIKAVYKMRHWVEIERTFRELEADDAGNDLQPSDPEAKARPSNPPKQSQSVNSTLDEILEAEAIFIDKKRFDDYMGDAMLRPQLKQAINTYISKAIIKELQTITGHAAADDKCCTVHHTIVHRLNQLLEGDNEQPRF